MTNLPTPENELEQKKQFALELLKTPDKAFEVACRVFGDDTGRALIVARSWPDDPVVRKFQEEAVNDVGDMHFLPTKAEAARKAWEWANNEKMHVEDRQKALRLYCDIRGFVEKQGPVVNVQNNLTNNRVMVVKDHGNDEQWEQGVLNQQSKLIEAANAPRVH